MPRARETGLDTRLSETWAERKARKAKEASKKASVESGEPAPKKRRRRRDPLTGELMPLPPLDGDYKPVVRARLIKAAPAAEPAPASAPVATGPLLTLIDARSHFLHFLATHPTIDYRKAWRGYKYQVDILNAARPETRMYVAVPYAQFTR